MVKLVTGSGRPKASLSQHAYLTIRDAILRGDYPLGAALSRRKLAVKLGMSILPVSEALQRLSSEGLVVSWPRVGTIVKIPTPQEIRGSFVIREALECQAARLFAEKAPPARRTELREMADDLDKQWTNVNTTQVDIRERMLEIRKRHMQLHMDIAEASGVPALVQAIERNNVLVFATMYDSLLGYLYEPSDWHLQLMDALVGNDPDRAEVAMRHHVRLGLEDLLERLEPYLHWDQSKLLSLREKKPVGAGRQK